MKISKSKRNHPCWYASVKDDSLCIETNLNKYNLFNLADWDLFLENIEKTGEIEDYNSFLCSSSIDFPKDSTDNQEVIALVEYAFYS